MQPPRRRGVRGRLAERLKQKVRYWVDGPEILHWDDPRHPVAYDEPTFAPMKVLEAARGPQTDIRVGRYTGVHYTVVAIPGGMHHVDWIAMLHGHVEDGRWVTRDDAVYGKGPIVIGSDVWVGFESLLTSGVTIGHGAVVAARSVVVKDVEPYSIVGGNPARHVRYRFEEPVREALLRIAWWDWPDDKVAAHADLIHSPRVEEFVAGHDPELGPPSCELCRS